MYYKSIVDNYITALATKQEHWKVYYISDGLELTEITESEFNELLSVFQTKPKVVDGYKHCLRADTLTWERVELPPVEEQDEEATVTDYESALQDLGVLE